MHLEVCAAIRSTTGLAHHLIKVYKIYEKMAIPRNTKPPINILLHCFASPTEFVNHNTYDHEVTMVASLVNHENYGKISAELKAELHKYRRNIPRGMIIYLLEYNYSLEGGHALKSDRVKKFVVWRIDLDLYRLGKDARKAIPKIAVFEWKSLPRKKRWEKLDDRLDELEKRMNSMQSI